jgi:hypothetical protein
MKLIILINICIIGIIFAPYVMIPILITLLILNQNQNKFLIKNRNYKDEKEKS